MAPEIMRNTSYNNQTDLWSVGMILYEMLFGFHPFEKCKSISELNTKIKNEIIQVPPENTKNKDISKECLELLNMLLQKDVKNRVTWNQFFNHMWFYGYKYMIPIKKENNIRDYEREISSVSVGSLATRDQKEYFSRPNVKLEIIENYIDSQMNDSDINQNNKDNIKCPDGGIFNMEFDEQKDIKIKSVIEKSSVLEEVYNKAHQYEIIDEF
jgi:serine/threonine protein kinase